MGGDEYIVHGAAAVGPAAHAHDVTVNSNHLELNPELSLSDLALELQQLRQKMQQRAEEPEQYLALTEICLAEKSAGSNDRRSVLAHLAKAGKWSLDIATEIGTKVAVAAITQAGGFSS